MNHKSFLEDVVNNRKLARKFSEIFKESGAYHFGYLNHYVLLNYLDENPNTNQTKLSVEIGYDKASLSKTIDNLLDRGLLTRKASTKDRRQTVIEITDLGKEVLECMNEKLENYEHE